MNTEPSKAARRAAEAIWQTHDADGPPEAIAEIIERETGAGEAVQMVEQFMRWFAEYPCFIPKPEFTPQINELQKQAKSFLQRFNQD